MSRQTTFCCMRNVYIFPNGLHLDGIPGYLSVINDGEDCITWTPYSLVNTQLATSNERTLAPIRRPDIYTMRIPLSDILSIRQSFPKFGQPSIVIVVKEKISLNPFYFYEGGIKEVIKIVQQLKHFAPSDSDPNLLTLVESPFPFGFNLPPPPSESTPNQQPYSPTHPIMTQFDQDSSTMPQSIQNSSLSPANAWNFLSGVRKLAKDATTAIWYEGDSLDNNLERKPSDGQLALDIDDFEIVNDNSDINRLTLAEQTVRKQPRREPLSSEDWINSFDQQGRICNVEFLREKIYHGGMEPSLRPEAWKYLLGYYPFESTYKEREIIQQQKQVEYSIYRSQWESITEEQESHFSKFRSLKERIDKDVVRTDRTWQIYESDDSPQLQEIYRILLTYSFFNFDIGYVQGMNDLVSVLLIVTQNEVDAFWCFKGFMDRIMDNFDKDQVGMHTQLTQLSEIVKYMDPVLYQHLLEAGGTNMFFCFKWLLIVFKREFPLDSVQRLWEVLWSDHYCSHHQLFICLAMLLSTKNAIIEENMEFDDILRHLNSTSKTMDAENILEEADYQYRKFITVCDTKTQNRILNQKVPPPPMRARKRSV